MVIVEVGGQHFLGVGFGNHHIIEDQPTGAHPAAAHLKGHLQTVHHQRGDERRPLIQQPGELIMTNIAHPLGGPFPRLVLAQQTKTRTVDDQGTIQRLTQGDRQGGGAAEKETAHYQQGRTVNHSMLTIGKRRDRHGRVAGEKIDRTDKIVSNLCGDRPLHKSIS